MGLDLFAAVILPEATSGTSYKNLWMVKSPHAYILSIVKYMW